MSAYANWSLLLFGPKDWPTTLATVRETFPRVEQVSTADVAARHVRNGSDPLLIDVRTAAEFEVSRIPGALNVETDAELKKLASLAPNRVIVVYCSIGYRSSAIAAKLHDQGVTNVVNLEGSIFKWANEGRALETGRGASLKAVSVVHPYNAKWGKLLDPARRASLEPVKTP